jgi:hypothetical protein
LHPSRENPVSKCAFRMGQLARLHRGAAAAGVGHGAHPSRHPQPLHQLALMSRVHTCPDSVTVCNVERKERRRNCCAERCSGFIGLEFFFFRALVVVQQFFFVCFSFSRRHARLRRQHKEKVFIFNGVIRYTKLDVWLKELKAIPNTHSPVPAPREPNDRPNIPSALQPLSLPSPLPRPSGFHRHTFARTREHTPPEQL